MRLLHLPVEVVRNVLHQFVTDAGIKEAWPARVVCRIFAAEIYDDLVANQPLVSFSKAQAHLLFRMLAAPMLYERTRKPMDVDPVFLNVIKDMVTTLMQHVGESDTTVRSGYTRMLCEAAAPEFMIWHHGPGSSPVRTYRAVPSTDQVAAAFATGDEALVDKVCALFSPNGTEQSYLFGKPLVNLVKAGASRLFLSRAIGHLPGLTGRQARPLLLQCIHVAIPKNDAGQVEVILEKLLGNRTFLAKYMRDNFIHAAVVADALDVVKYMMTIKTEGKPRILFQTFKLACKSGKVEITKCLLGKDFLDPDRTYYNDSPLNMAVVTRKPEMVQALLDAGANPSGPIGTGNEADRNIPFPLSTAIRNGDESIVRMLIDAGATLKARRIFSDHPLREAFVHSTRAMYEIIRQAKMTREGIAIPPFKEMTLKRLSTMGRMELGGPENEPELGVDIGEVHKELRKPLRLSGKKDDPIVIDDE